MTEIENVLIVVADALRVDRVEMNDPNLTPNLDSLANSGEYFQNCYSTINATDASMTSIMSGQYPSHHGVLHHGHGIPEKEKRYASNTTFIQELLEDHRTIGVDILDRWHSSGFDVYSSEADENDFLFYASKIADKLPDQLEVKIRTLKKRLSSEISAYDPADSVTDQFISELQNTQGKWFGLVHYWDTHIPYVPPEEHPEVVNSLEYDDEEEDLSAIISRHSSGVWFQRLKGLSKEAETTHDLKRKYDAGVHKVDTNVGRIISYLKNTGQYENTLIIVTADHGESLTEHGIYFEHHGLYDESVHVPLIINGPGYNGTESGFVQHTDIVPTIIETLQLEEGITDTDGTSLVPSESGTRNLSRTKVFFEEAHTTRKRAVRTDQYKLITRMTDEPCDYCNIYHAKTDELYNLKESPNETKNSIKEETDIADGLRNEITKFYSSFPEPSGETKEFETTETVMNRLENLGYK